MNTICQQSTNCIKRLSLEQEKTRIPHIGTHNNEDKILLIPFINQILDNAASAAPAVLHAVRPLEKEKVVQWQVFSSQTYGRQPFTVATMDEPLFRSSLAYLSNTVIKISPYVGARSFSIHTKTKTYQCVGMIQNTPGCNWVTITFMKEPAKRWGKYHLKINSERIAFIWVQWKAVLIFAPSLTVLNQVQAKFEFPDKLFILSTCILSRMIRSHYAIRLAEGILT